MMYSAKWLSWKDVIMVCSPLCVLFLSCVSHFLPDDLSPRYHISLTCTSQRPSEEPGKY